MAVTASGEEGDPTSRYQNPRYSGKGVPDRGNDPKRKIISYKEKPFSLKKVIGFSLEKPITNTFAKLNFGYRNTNPNNWVHEKEKSHEIDNSNRRYGKKRKG